MKLLIGADPEVFAAEGSTLISAHDLIPGDKKNPHKVTNGAIQVDGVAMEFNIDPANSEEIFVRNIFSVYGQMLAIARKKNPKVRPVIAPIVRFNKTLWDGIPDGAKVLGCDLDMCAYKLEPRHPPNPPMGVRTAAGHIHIGWGRDMNQNDPYHLQMCAELAKALDVAFKCTNEIDPKNAERQQYYGPWGAFRPKPYGMEYRSLSNFWLRSEELARWVYQRTVWTVAEMIEGREVRPDTLGTAPIMPTP